MSKTKKGHYGAFFLNNQQIGGFIYWNISEKPPICYCTSCWWLYKDIKQCMITLYEVKRDELQVVEENIPVEIKSTHRLILGKPMKGAIELVILK